MELRDVQFCVPRRVLPRGASWVLFNQGLCGCLLLSISMGGLQHPIMSSRKKRMHAVDDRWQRRCVRGTPSIWARLVAAWAFPRGWPAMAAALGAPGGPATGAGVGEAPRGGLACGTRGPPLAAARHGAQGTDSETPLWLLLMVRRIVGVAGVADRTAACKNDRVCTVMEARPGSHKRRLSGSDLPFLPEGEPAPGSLLDGAAAYYGDSAASQTDVGEGDPPTRPVGHRVHRVRICCWTLLLDKCC